MSEAAEVTVFTVWAPAAARVELEAAGSRHPMTPAPRPGWWQAELATAAGGVDYAFRLDGPPPRSCSPPWPG